jgi:hypothetical protein
MTITIEDYNDFVKQTNEIRQIPLQDISIEKRIEKVQYLINRMFSDMAENEFDFYLMKCRFIYEATVEVFKTNKKQKYALVDKTRHNNLYRKFKAFHRNKANNSLRELEMDFRYVYYHMTAEINKKFYPHLNYDFTKEKTRNVLILTCLDRECYQILEMMRKNL